jgi:uncharacterized protein
MADSEQPKPERPRDELGRPLPWGAESKLELLDYDALPLEENHRLAREYYNEGKFFQAHEAWEGAWRKAHGSEDEEFFKGLAQIGAGYTHYRRGNSHGAKTLLRRGLTRIREYGPAHAGLDVEQVAAAAEEAADLIERAEEMGRRMPEIRLSKI